MLYNRRRRNTVITRNKNLFSIWEDQCIDVLITSRFERNCILLFKVVLENVWIYLCCSYWRVEDHDISFNMSEWKMMLIIGNEYRLAKWYKFWAEYYCCSCKFETQSLYSLVWCVENKSWCCLIWLLLNVTIIRFSDTLLSYFLYCFLISW